MSPTWPNPLWIAHRGAGKLAPENTLAAFRHGASHGYRAFECDVKLSADGVPFLLHDDTLDRTTSGHGDADGLAWSDLSRLDAGGWHSRGFAGEPPASLDAVARYVRRNGFALNIEIKPMPKHEERTGTVVAEHARRLWAGDTRPPLLTSFKPAALQGALVGAPELPRGLLLDSLWTGWFDAARDLECKAVVSLSALLDPTLVVHLRQAGMKVLVYTVNEPAEARRLLRLQVDGIITDAVDRFSPVEGGSDA
ncbi:MAG TPA: glycerophosphodiester phosphodiesterase [Burkholderiaceae bacterium]|nr:glycerophosphodiester phosphodiesterase [Burkholderiaceae bacterium]